MTHRHGNQAVSEQEKIMITTQYNEYVATKQPENFLFIADQVDFESDLDSLRKNEFAYEACVFACKCGSTETTQQDIDFLRMAL